MKPIRVTGIFLVLVLSGFLATETSTRIDFLYKQLIQDTEGIFVANPRGLVPMLTGQLFFLISFFLRSNLFIKSGLVAMGIGCIFFLDDVYKELNGLQTFLYILFAISGIALYWWAWKTDNR
jgi:hypothetical protein